MHKMGKIGSKVKKVASISLASAMMLGTLSGCGGSTPATTAGGGDGTEATGTTSGDSKSDEPITLTVFSQRANYSGEQIGWSAEVLKEKFNVKLNIVPNSDGVLDTRLESGDLGDIVIFGSEQDYMKCVEAGALFDWEEDDTLAEYGPYIKENMSHALEKNRGMNPDNKIYGLGYEVATSSDDIQSFMYTWDLRWDLYKELGYPEVNNLDDYVDMLKQMKELCPEDESGKPTYALSAWPDWDGNMVMYVKSMATAYYGYDEFALGLYNPTDGHFYGALGNPDDPSEKSPYLEMLDFFHKLYANDLLDPDSMTNTYDKAAEKVKKGGTFFSIFNYAGYMLYNTEAHIAENKMMRTMKPNDASPIAYGLNVLGGNNYFAIGAKTEYPDICMEILNYMCTPEGFMTVKYGRKGETWDYDEDGNTYFTEFGKKCNNDKNTPMEDGSGLTFHDGELQINCLTWTIDASNPDSNGETYNYEHWKSNQAEPVCDTDADWREHTGASSIDEYMAAGNYVVSPGSPFVLATQSDELKTTWAQVTKCLVDNSWKAIYASSDEEYQQIVDDMISQCNEYGYKTCWDWSNEQAQLRKAAEDGVAN